MASAQQPSRLRVVQFTRLSSEGVERSLTRKELLEEINASAASSLPLVTVSSPPSGRAAFGCTFTRKL